MTGERRRIEYVVARGPARLMAAGGALIALGSLAMIGCIWQWARVTEAPPSMLWLIGGSALAYFLGGVLTLLAYGMVRS